MLISMIVCSAGASRSAALIHNVHSTHGQVFLGCYGRFTAHSLVCNSNQAAFAVTCLASIWRCILEHFPSGFELPSVLCTLHGGRSRGI